MLQLFTLDMHEKNIPTKICSHCNQVYKLCNSTITLKNKILTDKIYSFEFEYALIVKMATLDLHMNLKYVLLFPRLVIACLRENLGQVNWLYQ